MSPILKTAAIFSTCLSATLLSAGEPGVSYPDDYRHWTHAKTMLIQPGHPLANPFEGIHHIYVNKQAKEGMDNGHYRDGATIVFDLLGYTAQDNTIQEGERKFIGVMYKSASQYKETGGWGFEVFAGDSRTDRQVKDGGAACFACHTSEKVRDYVFSSYRN